MRPAGLSARVPHQDRAVLGDDVPSLGQRQLKAARAPLIRFSEGQVVRGEVEWVDLDDVSRRLAYPNERRIVAAAREILVGDG